MMFLLILNIPDYPWYMGFGIRKSTVSPLPVEWSIQEPFFVFEESIFCGISRIYRIVFTLNRQVFR